MSILTISKEQLISRLKSLGWRVLMMGLAIVVAFLIDNLNVVNLPPTVIAVIGLVLGEISKQINKNLATLKGLAGQK
ncbi:MAG: hypothetical protein WC389_20975 [Lutibacter sp.]|jgi:hypothetical protein